MRNTRQIVLLTGRNNFFGQTRKPWVSLDTALMIIKLNSLGYDVSKYTFHEIVNEKVKLNDELVFYTFGQKSGMRDYIKDALYYLHEMNNDLIPKYDLLLCHENKGYQELYKKVVGINSLNSLYLSSIDDLKDYKIEYPIVMKTPEGSNGTGVFLIRNKAELVERYRKFTNVGLLNSLDLIRRKYFRKEKKYKEYPAYSNKEDYFQYKKYLEGTKSFILQDFIPGLMFDFRVLVLFDKYFVMKRHIKKEDFKASGSKKFDFNFNPDRKLLEFARTVFKKVDSPFLSIDIAFDGRKYYLLEFQALHFGISVYKRSLKYYKYHNGDWLYEPNSEPIENVMMEGLVGYIEANNLNDH